MKTVAILLVCLVSLASAQFFGGFFGRGRPFRRPQFQRFRPQFQQFRPQFQQSRPQFQQQRGGLYMSWRDPRFGPQAEFGWFQANQICNQRGQRLVSIDSPQKSSQINNLIANDGVRYIWTSGRGSAFDGFTWGNGQAVQPINWSRTGGSGSAQPDNREGNEFCLAVLNNFYQDGVVWHDVACHHQKPFICE